MKRHGFLIAAIAASLAFPHAATQAPGPAAVDAVFARWTAATPGCAVGVGVKGRTVLERAYGMADLEREVENAPDTIWPRTRGGMSVVRQKWNSSWPPNEVNWC
jgi:CubicO group peptidase (beta-lactamase class C family)